MILAFRYIMVPVPNIFRYLYHKGKNKKYPAPQDGNSALRQERQGFLASSLNV